MIKKLLLAVIRFGVILAVIEVSLPGKYFWYTDPETDKIRHLLRHGYK